MRFKELPPEKRPNSEASGSTRSDASANISRDLVSTVIERWRSATMSHRTVDDEFADYGAAFEAPPLQPQQAPSYQQQAPAYQSPPPPAAPARPELRSSLLKKPLDAGSFPSNPPNMPRFNR